MVLPCRVCDGMYCKESICSSVRPECSGDFLLYLQFSDSPLAGIVVRWYSRILQKVEYVVSAFEEPLAHPFEMVFQMEKVGLQQDV